MHQESRQVDQVSHILPVRCRNGLSEPQLNARRSPASTIPIFSFLRKPAPGLAFDILQDPFSIIGKSFVRPSHHLLLVSKYKPKSTP